MGLPEFEPDPMSDRHLAETWNNQPEYLGEFLAQIRREQGRDLREVSATLRIRLPYLQAIEQSRYDQLPGTPYAIGFLRSYAETLGLDPEQVVRRFKEEIQGRQNKANLVFPAPQPEGRIPGGALVLVSLLLIGLCYGAWELWKSQGEDLIAMVPSPSQVLRDGELDAPPGEAGSVGQDGQSAPENATAADGVSDYVPPAAGDLASGEPPARAPATAPSAGPASQPPAVPQGGTAEESAPQAPVASAAPRGTTTTGGTPAATAPSPVAGTSPATEGASEVQTAARTPATAPGAPAAEQSSAAGDDDSAIPEAPATEAPSLSPNPSGRVYGGRSDGRVILQARADSWVQVLGPSNRPVFTQLLRAGDRYVVPDEAGLKLLTGNAGGLEIWVDGKPTPSLGPQGAVRRDIALDPDQLRAAAVN